MADLVPPLRADRVSFEYWEDCWQISNGIVDLVVPVNFGPRVMRFGFCGSRNLFKIYDRPVPGERIRGGHRLWAAPEVAAFTWANDTAPVAIEVLSAGLHVTGAMEAESGLQKEMRISLSVDQADARVLHRFTNRGAVPLHVAPWALTQMAAGGCSVSAFPPRGEHPRDLLPTGSLVMWAYTDFTDPKWKLLRKYWVLRQDAAHPEAQKGGTFLEAPWGAYLLGDELFVKRSVAPVGPVYPDLGCSFEIFANGKMVELETLAGLRTIAPGESAEHEEHWTLHRGIQMSKWSDDEIDATIAALI
jgi:hypothetical protein